jgi:hypothetical protein
LLEQYFLYKLSSICARMIADLDRLARAQLGGETIIATRKELGAIFFSIPPGCREVPGFYYIITRSLAFNNITILAITNVETDFVILLHNDDVARAYNVLFSLIQSRRFLDGSTGH